MVELDLEVRLVAERLALRLTAPAEAHRRALLELPLAALRVDDAERALDDQGSGGLDGDGVDVRHAGTLACAGTRVRGLEGLAQVVAGHVGVDLRRADAL